MFHIVRRLFILFGAANWLPKCAQLCVSYLNVPMTQVGILRQKKTSSKIIHSTFMQFSFNRFTFVANENFTNVLHEFGFSEWRLLTISSFLTINACKLGFCTVLLNNIEIYSTFSLFFNKENQREMSIFRIAPVLLTQLCSSERKGNNLWSCNLSLCHRNCIKFKLICVSFFFFEQRTTIAKCIRGSRIDAWGETPTHWQFGQSGWAPNAPRWAIGQPSRWQHTQNRVDHIQAAQFR